MGKIIRTSFNDKVSLREFNGDFIFNIGNDVNNYKCFLTLIELQKLRTLINNEIINYRTTLKTK